MLGKLKILLLLFLYVADAKSQCCVNPETKVLTLISDISNYSNKDANVLFIKDTIRGGVFNLYNGDNPVDNGMIFQDALGNKWIRSGVDEVNIKWFGAKTDGSDNRQKIIDAINSAKLNLSKVNLYIPKGSYYVSDSIEFTSLVQIYGDGNESYLRFAAHKTGLVFAYPGSQYSVLKNVSIIGEGSSAYGDSSLWDNSKHGIIVRSPVDFDGVWVRYFDGCGIYMDNDLTSSYPGNSNTSTFHDCHIYNNLLHGIFLRGGDANAISINNCDIVSNGGAGIMDRSFLGNNYSGNHTATNGSPELRAQRGLVKSGGTVYACIKDTTIGVAPPNSTYWQDIGSAWISFPYVDDYNANSTYFAVGSYIFEGLNQYGVMTGNYAETDQAPGFIDQGNIMIGGGGFSSRAKYPTIIYSSSSKITTKSFFKSEHGVGSKWIYAGNMGEYIDLYNNYPSYSGVITGSNNAHALVDFWDYYTNIGQFYTNENYLNMYTMLGKGYRIYTNATSSVSRLSVLPSGNVGIGVDNPTSKLTINGSFASNIISKTSNYTATENDNTIVFTEGTDTLTLPSAYSIEGREYLYKNLTGNNGVIYTTGGEMIDGVSGGIQGIADKKYIRLKAFNGNWVIIGNN